MLKITQLNAGYDDLLVLKDINLELAPGKIYVLMGPNGAGKSTLLKSIFNLTTIQSGKIFFNDKDITGSETHQLLEFGIAYLPQGRINFSELTVEENLLLGAYHTENKAVREKLKDQIFKEFPVLKEKRRQYAFSLSGGQQQMLAFGRALMNSPKLLLLDEPSLGLSPKLVTETFQKIKQINTTFQTTILIVEHNIKSVFKIADQAYIMVNGQIEFRGLAEKLQGSAVLRKVFLGEFD